MLKDIKIMTTLILVGKPLIAASNPDSLGANVADRDWLETSPSGGVDAGSAILNKATDKPFEPFAASVRAAIGIEPA